MTQKENRECDNEFELFSELEVPVKMEFIVNPGTYLVQFIYENYYLVWEEQIYNNPRSNLSKMEDIWVGEVYTYPIEFDLIMY